MEDDLEKEVAELTGKLARVARIHCVEHFVRFLDQKFAKRGVGLFAVPRALIRGAKARLERDQPREPFACKFVAGVERNERSIGGAGFASCFLARREPFLRAS